MIVWDYQGGCSQAPVQAPVQVVRVGEKKQQQVGG